MAEKNCHCLICHTTGNQCSSKSQKIFNCRDDTKSTENSSTEIAAGTRIQSQLEVIFILRKLLHIPLPSLVEYLEFSGGENPDCWISLCDECQLLVESVRTNFEEIISATKKFNAIQERVVKKLKDSLTEESVKTSIRNEDVVEEKDKLVEIREFVTESCREFVRKHDYKPLQDPSIIGDILVNKALQTPAILPLSSPPRSPNHLDIDEDYESISSPINCNSDIKLEDENEKNESAKKSKPLSRSRRLIDIEGAFLGEGGRVMFKCQVDTCGKIFRQNHNYQDHKLTHYAVRPKLSCDICDGQFYSKEGLRRHKKKGHEKKPPPKSKKTTRSKTSTKPKSITSPASATPDTEVGEDKAKEPVKKLVLIPRSKNPTKLINQEGAFRGEGGLIMFKCQVDSCGRIFRGTRSYNTHKFVHSSEKRPKLSCDLCDAQFYSRVGLYKHFHRVHEQKPPPPHKKVPDDVKMERKIRYQRTCPHCGYQTDKYTLPLHIRRVHENLYPISCELCGHGVSSKMDLNRHQAQVHGICSVDGCKQTFENRGQLRKHQVDIHGKEIDVLSCPECGNLFVKTGGLRRHLSVHELERKEKEEGQAPNEFVCDLCGKAFGIRDRLLTHKWQVHQRGRKRKKKGSPKS